MKCRPLSIARTATLATAVPLLLMLGSCAGQKNESPGLTPAEVKEAIVEATTADTTADATSTASTVESYKQDIAQRISQVSSTRVYTTRPQALLRAVIVVKFTIDSQGRLVSSSIARSNHDRAAEQTAMTTLRNAAPFPKPASHLIRNGKLEISESWLFNTDGRFQLRSIALPQMDQ